jgi:hypothetical protein
VEQATSTPGQFLLRAGLGNHLYPSLSIRAVPGLRPAVPSLSLGAVCLTWPPLQNDRKSSGGSGRERCVVQIFPNSWQGKRHRREATQFCLGFLTFFHWERGSGTAKLEKSEGRYQRAAKQTKQLPARQHFPPHSLHKCQSLLRF